MLNHVGAIGLDDQAYPINSELLYVTRLGMVWLLQGTMVLLHSTGIWTLRLITILSLVVLTASSIVFARRWSRASALMVVACVLLTPGILESSFFIADNLVAAALTSLALALVSRHVKFPRWFTIGAVLACAMLVRLDAVLAVPAVLAVLWLALRKQPDKVKRLTVALSSTAAGAFLVFFISQRATGISLLMAWHVGRLFSQINNNSAIYQTGMPRTIGVIFFGFFGLITLPLIALGAWTNYKSRRAAWSVVMTLMPMLFYMAVLTRANEIRDFCLMGAPFVLLQAATGLHELLALARSGHASRKTFAIALLGFFVLVFVAPPYLSMRDGPRALTGRLYAPIFWRQWQSRTLAMIGQIHTLVDQVQPGERILIINSQFEPDRYLHLRLLQQGFQIEPNTSPSGDCASIETARQGKRNVVSIRTENPYGIVHEETPPNALESLQIAASLRCLQDVKFNRAYFFSIGPSGEDYWPGLTSGVDRSIPQHFPLPLLHSVRYGFLGVTPLTPAQVSHLQQAARESVQSGASSASAPSLNGSSFRSLFRHRFWFPPAPASNS